MIICADRLNNAHGGKYEYKKRNIKTTAKKILSIFLSLIIVLTGINYETLISSAQTSQSNVTLYIIDNTSNKWLGNDNAIFELVDNTNGHDHYIMTKVDDVTWSVSVPASAYNITFNRLSPDGKTQWNSWSAGGRDANNAYYADGAEYGHWEKCYVDEQNYFKFGDIIYLDISEFSTWKNDGAKFYVNFSDYSKENNGGQDVSIGDNINIINPQSVNYEVSENVYAYAVSKEDEGSNVLRFWRGNDTTLWNCSVALTYEQYKDGENSIKIKGWNEAGISCECQKGFDMNDDDNDGLPNFYEDLINADKNNKDSDGDSLIDGYEIFTTLTNPTKADTDDNGIVDGDEDFDDDNLSTLYECELGINPKGVDTDGDGLGDFSELKYKMNPNDQDTLDDGIKDGDRIFDIVYDGEISDNANVIPHLSIELVGNQVDSLSVTKVDEDDNFLNSTIPGYIANGYDLYVDGTFEEATLSFEMSEELVNTADIEPTIYYWNEETQLLEEVENQYVEGNRICVKLEHFSRYMLIDKNKYNKEAFLYEIAAPNGQEILKKTFDVAFVLDESGSISSSEFATMKSQCSSLVDKFVDGDRVAVFTFDETVRKISSFTDIESAKTVLNSLNQSDGNTAVYDAIDTGVEEFKQYSSEEATKILVLLTDGYDNSSSVTLETAIQNAIDNNVVVYSIGIGSVNTNALKSVASRTGGVYYGINNFSQLEAVFTRLIVEADLYKDSDSDGLSDYHEKKIAAGEMCIGTGQSMKACSYMNYLSADSDGDGIEDGDEIEIKENSEGNYYGFLNSNPCLIDSDLDGYEDFVEDYIGTPLMSKHNLIVCENDVLDKNYYADWVELLEKHSWNYIHNLVQTHIIKKYTSIEKEYELINGKRVDLIRHISNEIWEVKPASYSCEPKLSKGLEQLEEYLKALGDDYQIGGVYISGDTFKTQEYTIKYINMQNGLILYNFKKNREQEQEQKVNEPVIEKGEDYIYEPRIASGGELVWTIVGVTVIVGTFAEDVLTLGGGVANDIPSVLWGLELIFGS